MLRGDVPVTQTLTTPPFSSRPHSSHGGYSGALPVVTVSIAAWRAEGGLPSHQGSEPAASQTFYRLACWNPTLVMGDSRQHGQVAVRCRLD